MKGKIRTKVLALLLCLTLLLISIGVVSAFAEDSIVTDGEMTDIKKEFESYLQQDTKRIENDGYVGAIQYTVYYDKDKGAVVPGYEGTPVVVYTINHPGIERVGTDSNKDIIQSMLDRGYVVVILDYLNNYAAVSPAIDYSSQKFRTDLRNGKILTADIFPAGSYDENFLAPSGYNVLLNQVFWEIDKHSTAGTLEKIVENWNSDFRATKGEKVVYWLHEDKTPKATQKGMDGSSVVWYSDASKTVATGDDLNEDGVPDDAKYTLIKWTKAETITDCVDPDGSFIDMNLYINIVYPTNPEKEVPVMSLANSSGYPTTSVTSADLRPQSNGFLYNGYANVVFDYLWVPMARSASWGYYDGSQGCTGDHMNYALMMYNDKLVNTAAMRYLRYLSLSNTTESSSKFNFDLDAFGVYGNSKGGWFSFLGEKDIQSALATGNYETVAEREEAINSALVAFTPERFYEGHHGETRYDNKEGVITADGFTVKAPTLQPWLTYGGEEIISGAQLTYAQNGSQYEDITPGHSPVFVSNHMADTYNAAFGYSNYIVNLCRELDIPLLNYEAELGHTLIVGNDMNWNVDAYASFFDYVNYYLNGGALKVAYTAPGNNGAGVAVTDKILIKFAGAVALSEVEKITVTDGNETLTGSWSSEFGDTEWTFTPNSMKGGTEYTVTVPATVTGKNGNAMAEGYTYTFITEYDNATAVEVNGNYYSFKAPALTKGNGFVFRFNVTNDAANTAALYAVSSLTDTEGTLLGSVNLRGKGSYEIDISDYVVANEGNDVTLLLKGAKAVGDTVVVNDPFDTTKPSSTGDKTTYEVGATIDGEKAYKVTVNGLVTKNVSKYYENIAHVFTYKNVTGGEKTTADNLGRTYTIEFDIYDTVSRTVLVQLNSMTNRTTYGTIDYDHVIFTTKTVANGWKHVKFDYTVYEADYGKVALGNTQSLAVYVSPDGNTQTPVYFNDLKVTEHVTDITVGGAVIAEKNDGSGAYVAPVSENPIALYNGETLVGEYATWSSAFAAYKSGYTVKLQSDYTLTDAALYSGYGAFERVNIDLGGYTLTSANTKNSLIWAKATGTLLEKTFINIKNGAVRLGLTPLVSYESSVAAGSGKSFDITLDNVYVGFADNAAMTELISASSIDSAVKAKVNFNLNDCVIDLPDDKHAKDAMTILPGSSADNLDLTYNVAGGSIKLDSMRWISILDKAMKVEFIASAGSYTELLLPESYTFSIGGSYLTEGGYAGYESAGTNAEGYVIYQLVRGENSTRYGIITDTYADESKYPFALFKDGIMIGGYSTWKAATTAAGANLSGSANVGKEAQLLLRDNYTNTDDAADGNALGKISGTLTIDLGTNTLTRSKPLFDLYTTADGKYDTSIIIKNGTLASAGSAIFDNQQSANLTFEKNYFITVEGVTFTFSDGVTGGTMMHVIWNNSRQTPVCHINMSLNDCTFDLTGVTKATTLFNFTDGYDEYNGSVVMNGGEFIADSVSTVTILKGNSGSDSFKVGKGSDGNYPTLTVDAGAAAFASNTFETANGEYRYFKEAETNDTSTVYELVINPYATEYGVIPVEYSNASEYPFVVFDESKNFIGAYKYLYGNNGSGGAMNAAKTHVLGGGTDKNVYDLVTGKFTTSKYKAYVLMRDNYTTKHTASGDAITEYWDNLAQICGEVTLDLGGFALTQNANLAENLRYALFPAQSKRWSTVTIDGVAVDYNFPTTLNVKNGYINTAKTGAIKYNSGNMSSEHKVITFNFDNVTFGLAEGATTADLLITYATDNYAGGLVINANNCTFDLKTNAPTKSTTLVNVNNSLPQVEMAFTFNGGKIVASSLENIVVCNTPSSNVSIAFAKNSLGEYITLELPSSAAIKPISVPTAEGEKYFVEIEDDGTTAVYKLRKLEIPADQLASNSGYLSAITNPFYVVDMSSGSASYVGSYANYNSAYAAALNIVKGSDNSAKIAKIVLLSDYITTSTDKPPISNVGGTLILDLGGNTMIRGDKGYIFDLYGGNTYTTTIKVMNGTLRIDTTKPMIGLDHGSGVTGKAKQVNFVFDNVTFGYTSNATAGTIFSVWDTGTGYGTKVNMIFNDCIFDYVSAPSGVVMLNAKEPSTSNGGTVDVTVVINGGSILADNIGAVTLYKVDSLDSVKFGDDTGRYTELNTSIGAQYPTVSYTSDEGLTLSFAKVGEYGEDRMIYVLSTGIKTEYGYIPPIYESATEYPFIVFNEKGEVIGTAKNLFGANASGSAIDIAKVYMDDNVWDGESYGTSPRAAFILMRCDYTYISGETYNNLAQVQGEVTIDLGGNKLNGTSGKVMFPACIKPWTGSGDASVFPTTFTVKNGYIYVYDKAVIDYNAWTGSNNIDVSEKYYTHNFENVTFGIQKGGKATNLIANFSQHSSTPEAKGTTFINLTDCNIDLASVAPAGSMTIFANSGKYITNTYTVKGGNIAALTTDALTVFDKSDDSACELVFEKDSNGKLTTLTLPEGVALPDESYNVSGVSCVFSNGVVGEDGVVYSFISEVFSDFSVKTSVTLWSDFIYNIYVPYLPSINAITLDGVEITELGSFERVTLDDGEYYHVKVALGANQSLRSIKIKISAENSGSISYTLSLIKYAKNIIAGNHTAIEKTLVKDMLSYARAAYAYAGVSAADELTEVDAILGEGYDAENPAEFAGEAKVPSGNGVSDVTMVLGAVPEFRFYVASGVNPEDFVFTYEGAVLEGFSGSDGYGTYASVKMYAYQMIGDISYTVTGTDYAGTYNALAYYEWACENESANTKLIALVERFAKYCESAKAYKTSVVSGS